MRGRSPDVVRIALGVLVFVLLARSARADDASELRPEACRERYSLFHPAPRACLDAIDTDRPHKTDTPHTVPPGHAQVEMGVVEYTKAHWHDSSDDALVLLNNEYRLGLTRTIDAEALFTTVSIPTRSPRLVFGNRLVLRTKIGVFGDDESPTMVSVVPTVVVPVAPSGTFEGGGFVFLGAELPLELELEVDAGALSQTIAGTTRRRGAVVVTTALTRKLAGPVSAFGEIYSETATDDLGGIGSTLDGGVLLALGADAQLDFGAYVGLWGNEPSITTFLGFSVRR